MTPDEHIKIAQIIKKHCFESTKGGTVVPVECVDEIIRFCGRDVTHRGVDTMQDSPDRFAPNEATGGGPGISGVRTKGGPAYTPDGCNNGACVDAGRCLHPVEHLTTAAPGALLRFCDAIDKGSDFAAYSAPQIKPLARALKSRLQAEAQAPAMTLTDTELEKEARYIALMHGGHVLTSSGGESETVATRRLGIGPTGWRDHVHDYVDKYWREYKAAADMTLTTRKSINAPTTAASVATAPKHALRCGYWLDLNCSCGLEARQGL